MHVLGPHSLSHTEWQRTALVPHFPSAGLSEATPGKWLALVQDALCQLGEPRFGLASLRSEFRSGGDDKPTLTQKSGNKREESLQPCETYILLTAAGRPLWTSGCR